MDHGSKLESSDQRRICGYSGIAEKPLFFSFFAGDALRPT